MICQRIGEWLVIRMEVGDDLVGKITEAVKKEGMKLATVQGIGACDILHLGLYKVEEKTYYEKEMKGDFELLSLMGNITTKDNQPYLHLHALISDENLQAFGGHLKYARISATGEIFIREIQGEVDRFFDEDTGLNLLKL